MSMLEAGAACQTPFPCPIDCKQLLHQAQTEIVLAWQVNCRDRRGLLADVISALKSFPLEITTAAVTTTADGYVYDVFQVRASTVPCLLCDVELIMSCQILH